ncbi:MAG: hypothetical protein LBF17_00335 [Mediterranea sp.]|jgi:hypothetical protein|nr:hypothetical protein [Mediterranea sp.]
MAIEFANALLTRPKSPTHFDFCVGHLGEKPNAKIKKPNAKIKMPNAKIGETNAKIEKPPTKFMLRFILIITQRNIQISR